MANPSQGGDEEGVVDPEDLDITDDDRVLELRDGQYVVTTDGPTVDLDEGFVRESEGEDPRTVLRRHVTGMNTDYGFTVAGRFGGSVHDHEVFSDDVETVFRELVTWYARNVDAGTPPPEVVGILCQAADVRIRYPLRTVADLLNAYDLSPDDTIDDLITALREDGLTLPPE